MRIVLSKLSERIARTAFPDAKARDTVEWFKHAGVHFAEAWAHVPRFGHHCRFYLHQLKIGSGQPCQRKIALAPTETSIRGKESLMAGRTDSNRKAIWLSTCRIIGAYDYRTPRPLYSVLKFVDSGLQGLSFPEVTLKLTLPGKKAFCWGLSGPAILKLSAWAAREMKQAKYKGTLTVNLI